MRFFTATLLACLLYAAHSSSSAEPTAQRDGCSIKATLIERHLALLERTAAAQTEASSPLTVKRRAFTLLVDVKRSLARAACQSEQEKRLNELEERLQSLMLANS